MSQEKDINLKLSIYELIMVLSKTMKTDDQLKVTTCQNIVAAARKFARTDG